MPTQANVLNLCIYYPALTLAGLVIANLILVSARNLVRIARMPLPPREEFGGASFGNGRLDQ